MCRNQIYTLLKAVYFSPQCLIVLQKAKRASCKTKKFFTNYPKGFLFKIRGFSVASVMAKKPCYFRSATIRHTYFSFYTRGIIWLILQTNW